MEKKRCTAVILAAGSGSRMKSTTAKQFLPLNGKPLIWYSLHAVEQSSVIDDCILVASDVEYIRTEIVEKYQFQKVSAIVPGGGERWESVANAMKFLETEEKEINSPHGYVFIHDGARPFLTENILQNTLNAVQKYHACVAAVPSKDTIKLSDENGFVKSTPDRRTVWNIQTPQVFDRNLIVSAYHDLTVEAEKVGKENIKVTDDASVVELYSDCHVKLAEGSYTNIKVTTPEDLNIAKIFIENFFDKNYKKGVDI